MKHIAPLRSSRIFVLLGCMLAAPLLSSSLLQACDPVPDRITYEDKNYNAWSALHFYDYVQDKEGYTVPNSTAGYHARWRVTDRRVMLVGFDVDVDPKLKQVVEKRSGGIHAQWFSGVIRLLPKGSGTTQFAAEEVHLIVRRGMVESSRRIDCRRFVAALEAEYRRRGRAGSVFWDSLVRKQETREWVRALQPLTRQERIERVLDRQSEMMRAFQTVEGDLDRDDVIVAARLPGLIDAGYLEYALAMISAMP